jgi:hypothetical protein
MERGREGELYYEALGGRREEKGGAGLYRECVLLRCVKLTPPLRPRRLSLWFSSASLTPSMPSLA